MSKRKTSLIAAALASALLIGSPLALADDHRKPFGPRDMEKMCEQFRDGKGAFNMEKRKERMEERRAEARKRHEEMADRLKLTPEQREIWDEVFKERQKESEKRANRWQEKMEKFCE